jgi:putative ABC transport system permease protein
VFKGRPFLDSDFAKMRKVALLDEKAAELLYPEKDPIGRIVEIRNEPFIIVGLVKKSDVFQPVIETIQDYETYNQEEYGTVLIPDEDWPIVYNYDEPQNCVARAVSTEEMSDMGKSVEKIMKKSVGGSTSGENAITYKAEDLLEKARNKQELANSTNSLLIWIASIALLVGGIGVMNIMLVSVTERTNEIGLKKALGARNSRILAQFLTEAVVLTSLGGIIGVISGIVLAEVISRVSGTPVAISIPAIIGSVLFSMVIGFIFGFLPSVQAANLNPIDALRRE